MANTYTLIASNTLSSSAASVTFSAIPNTYTDLVLKISARGTSAASSRNLDLRINSDSTSLYSYTNLYASSSSAASQRASNVTLLFIGTMNANTSTANTFTNTEVYLPNYTVSTNKAFANFSVFENNSATDNELDIGANLYRSTSAIISVTFLPGADNFASGSSFFLYGIKNS